MDVAKQPEASQETAKPVKVCQSDPSAGVAAARQSAADQINAANECGPESFRGYGENPC
jgi:hypothetical protein